MSHGVIGHSGYQEYCADTQILLSTIPLIGRTAEMFQVLVKIGKRHLIVKPCAWHRETKCPADAKIVPRKR
jgi:hypothetical protein